MPTMENLPQTLSADTEHLRNPLLQSHWRQQLSQLQTENPSLLAILAAKVAQNPDYLAAAQRLLLGSEQAYDGWINDQGQWQALLNSDLLERNLTSADYLFELQQWLVDCKEEADLHRQLRLFRQKHMNRIIWRDLSRWADCQTTIADLSSLAEACLQLSLDWLHQRLCLQLGEPCNSSGEAQQLLIIAMGKLGARELNLSSDIDLIFAYPEAGETRQLAEKTQADNSSKALKTAKPLKAAKAGKSNQEFFTRLGQQLITAIDQRTQDGFVFRVDMRLRPYGQSGSLVASFAALENYYQSQGREWERYAMVKSRVITGTWQQRRSLENLLRPFTYRRYIDFSVIAALRELKAKIIQDVKHRGLLNNVKLGAGGIRDLEFTAQALQLTRGGRDRRLQQRQLLAILPLLAEEQWIDQEQVADLKAAYLFLRNTEHALQAWKDQQTQTLPDDPEQQLRLAMVMGFADWPEFIEALQQHQGLISRCFQQVIAEPKQQPETSAQADNPWTGVWRFRLEPKNESQEQQSAPSDHQLAIEKQLAEADFKDPQGSLNRLHQFKSSKRFQTLSPSSRQRLDQVMPPLLEAIAECNNPDQCLSRLLPLLEAIVKRSSYLVMLRENPNALRLLIKLCAASPWIASELSVNPILLDELLNQQTLYSHLDRDALADELQQQLLRINTEDHEQVMECLRYFRLSHSLRIAACEINGAIPLMKVSDSLTWLAEAILEATLDIAWQHTVNRYGRPESVGADDDNIDDNNFLVVGYGKFGGLEMGHSSDLDIVFIHDADLNGQTQGPKQIDNMSFYTRLGQRIVHMLTTRTLLGQLYEVDTRLRPSGSSGLLVSSLSGFAKYQEEQAWTWEHQALVRARPICGSARLSQAFIALRLNILREWRSRESLINDVCGMRDKMRANLGKTKTGLFHLKHGIGAIVDIEFIVQYAVLHWAHRYPELMTYTDNIRIIKALVDVGLITEEEAQLLTDAYKAYRISGHRLALQQLPAEAPETEFNAERRAVTALWERFLDQKLAD